MLYRVHRMCSSFRTPAMVESFAQRRTGSCKVFFVPEGTLFGVLFTRHTHSRTPMHEPSPLSRALEEAVSAMADAIEAHYRSTTVRDGSSAEVQRALTRAMRWASVASQIEFERQLAEDGTEAISPAAGARMAQVTAVPKLWPPAGKK